MEEFMVPSSTYPGLYPREGRGDGSTPRMNLVGAEEHLAQKHGVVFLSGPIESDTTLADYLLAVDSLKPKKPIKLVITSGGGFLDTAFILYDTIKALRTPLYTVGRWAGSGAVLLLVAGKKRFLLPNSRVMLHLPLMQMTGDAHLVDIRNKQIQKYKEDVVRVLLDNGATRSRERIIDDIDRELWLSPQEAIEYGLADQVLSPRTMQGWLR